MLVPTSFISLLISFMFFFQVSLADDTTMPAITTTLTSGSTTITTTTRSASPTLVWVTGTDSNGVTQTTQSAYTQKFISFYSTVAVPPTGSIGLGKISGTVGAVRKYPVIDKRS